MVMIMILIYSILDKTHEYTHINEQQQKYENLLNQVEKDSFVAMLGFQPKYEGSSPTVLRVDHHNKVVKVLHSSKSNPYAEGDTYSRIRQYYFYK